MTEQRDTTNTQRDLSDRIFWLPKEHEIKDAATTDVYFEYTLEALRHGGIDPVVTMEVYTRKSPFPDSNWLVLCGVYEVAKLLEGIPVDVDSMEEGSLSHRRRFCSLRTRNANHGQISDVREIREPYFGIPLSS